MQEGDGALDVVVDGLHRGHERGADGVRARVKGGRWGVRTAGLVVRLHQASQYQAVEGRVRLDARRLPFGTGHGVPDGHAERRVNPG